MSVENSEDKGMPRGVMRGFFVSVIGSALVTAAAGFAACWGTQANLPLGDFLNGLVPIICAIAVGWAGESVLGMVTKAMSAGTESGSDTQQEAASNPSNPPNAHGASVFVALILVALFTIQYVGAGLGGIFGAQCAGDTTTIAYILWVAGCAIAGRLIALLPSLALGAVLGAVLAVREDLKQ